MITGFKFVRGGCEYYVGNIPVSVKYKSNKSKHYIYIMTYNKDIGVRVADYINNNMMYFCECEYLYYQSGNEVPVEIDKKYFAKCEQYFLVDEGGLDTCGTPSTNICTGNHYVLLDTSIIPYASICDIALDWYYASDCARIIQFSDGVANLNKAGYNVDVICRMTNSGCYDILHVTLAKGGE